MVFTASTEILEQLKQSLEEHRVAAGERPTVTPVSWQGIGMTVQEAKMIIQGLENKKLKFQEDMNGTQTAGDVTKVAVGGAGLAAMVTGTALCLFPPTAIAGLITLVSGAGATKVGEVVGDGIKEIGTNDNAQKIRQIEEYINSLKSAIIDSI